MQKTATKPPPNELYETDFYAWTQEQARAIEERRWADVDAVNVADEVGSLGSELEREIGDRTEILLSYLLKWRQLAEYRGFAWKENIDRQRTTLAELFEQNASLADLRDVFVAEGYENAVRRLKYETYFFENDFPASCPFTVRQVFDANYFPEELDAPATGQFPTASSIG
jgi:Domain of unknown function DUF29